MRKLGIATAAVIASVLLCSGAEAAGTWNAYALDMKGGYGYALGMDSEREAKAAAVKDCGGGVCEAIFAIESQCIAVADYDGNEYWYGYAYGDTQRGTELIALGYCLDSNKGECTPLHSICLGSQSQVPSETGKSKL
jgi:hypothetical protein